MLFILEIKYQFTFSELNLHKSVENFQNVMTKIIGNPPHKKKKKKKKKKIIISLTE